MRSIPRLAAAAVALGALLPATAADATAAPAGAAGTARSAATLVSLDAFGQRVSLGALSALTTTAGALDAFVELTPATVNGAKTGSVSVTPATGPKDVASTGTGGIGAVPPALLSASSPAAHLAASIAGGVPTAGLTGTLGQATLLGTELIGRSDLTVASAVRDAGSSASKTLALQDIALPSLMEILNGLGLDLTALPLDAVRDLLESLPGTLAPAIEAAMSAAEDAQAAVDAAQAELAAAKAGAATAEAAVGSAAASVTQADAAVAAANQQVTAALAAAGMTMQAYETLPAELRPAAVTAALTGLTTARSAADAAAAVLTTANAGHAQAQAAVDAAQAALDAVLGALRTAIDVVLDSAAGILDAPLASIASVAVRSIATVSGDAKAKAAEVTGSISGLKVLDADVLALAGLGSSVDAVGTAASAVGRINAQVAQVLAPVFGALDGAVPGLAVPTPSVEFLTKQTATGVDGAFGTADASVRALTIELGAITIPAPVALPALPSLPGITQSASGISTAPIGIVLGQLSESARFRPASLAGAPIAPGAPGAPSLPRTGAPAGLAVAALVAIGLAAAVRRRTTDVAA